MHEFILAAKYSNANFSLVEEYILQGDPTYHKMKCMNGNTYNWLCNYMFAVLPRHLIEQEGGPVLQLWGAPG
jgi:hypothetical protein